MGDQVKGYINTDTGAHGFSECYGRYLVDLVRLHDGCIRSPFSNSLCLRRSDYECEMYLLCPCCGVNVVFFYTNHVSYLYPPGYPDKNVTSFLSNSGWRCSCGHRLTYDFDNENIKIEVIYDDYDV